MDTPPAAITHDDLPDVAHEVVLRLERWYEERRLALPAPTKAEFTRMAFEALLRHPQRPHAELLDELVLELDGMLADIVDEAPGDAGAPPWADARARAPRRSWLERLTRGRQ
ncbi:MAG TPA: hypothetical protein VIG68_00575 [Lysobacter sp.]